MSVRAGGVPVVLSLRPPSWSFDPEELKRAFSPRTKFILVNSPHNPTGKVRNDHGRLPDRMHHLMSLFAACRVAPAKRVPAHYEPHAIPVLQLDWVPSHDQVFTAAQSWS